LPDGTKVFLNAGTTLRYPDHFEGGSREVYLNGEAYLEVTKDAEHPFVVKTEEVEVRRLAGELGGDMELAIRQLAEGKR